MGETDIDSDLLFGVGLQVFLGETNKAAPAPVQQVSSVEPVIVELVTLSFAERCNAAGGLVEAGRCVKTSVVTEMVTLKVEFASGSDTVSSTYMPEVGKLAAFMKQYPTITIVIGGHTDSIGSSEYNQSLSQRRVNEVMRILISNYGIDAARLSALGYGETHPLVENNTEVNRAKNRRVEAAISVEVEETLSVDVK
jgi:OOP family OmpA-OmpF porin